jgi:hypothetical protein
MSYSTDEIINALSVLLPFANEVSIVLTNSGLSFFRDFYKICIHDDLIVQLPKAYRNDRSIDFIVQLPKAYRNDRSIVCTRSEALRRLFIDSIAFLGIVLTIGRSTMKFGYVSGVASGVLIIFFSMIVPSLFLSKIQIVCLEFLHVGIEKPFLRIFIGLLIIAALVIITDKTIAFTQSKLQKYKIDPANENPMCGDDNNNTLGLT